MKKFSIMMLIAATIACGCKQRAKERTIYNKEFDWTITIPAGFDPMTQEELDKIHGMSEEALEKTYGTEFEYVGKSLFGFKRNRTTYFFAYWETFDPAEDGDYEEVCRAATEVIYKTHEARVPRAQLDSFSATETISGIDFPVFRVKITGADKATRSRYSEYMYYRKLFGKRELLISIASADWNDQLSIMTAWRNSQFGADKGSPVSVSR